MADFRYWLAKKTSAFASEYDRDHATLTAQLEEALEKMRTAKVHTHDGHVISSAPDRKWRLPDCPSCHLVIQADSALAACKEFQEKYND